MISKHVLMAEIERRPAHTTELWYSARSIALIPPPVSTGFLVSLHPPLSRSAVLARVEQAVNRLYEFHPWLGARVEGWEGWEAWKKGEAKGKVQMVLREDKGEGAVRVVERTGVECMDDVLHFAHDCPISLKGRLWEVFVYLPTPHADLLETVYVGATIHHVLADGLSSLSVSRTLLLLLNTPSLELPSPRPAFRLPPPLDTLLDIRPGFYEISYTVFKTLVEPWLPSVLRALYTPRKGTTSFVGSEPVEPRRQHQLTYFVPSAQLGALRTVAKAHETTLTALLHTAIVLALLPLAPEGTNISSNTPASLLPLLPDLPQDGSGGGVYVGGFAYAHPQAAPFLPEPSTLSDYLALGAPYSALLRDQTSLQASIRKWGLVGMLDFPGLVKYHASPARQKLERKTFALSNLRSAFFSAGDIAAGWVPTQAWFTQTLKGSGAVMIVDVVSVDAEGEGGMSVSFGWEEGVCETEVVEGVRERVGGCVTWLIKQGEAERK